MTKKFTKEKHSITKKQKKHNPNSAFKGCFGWVFGQKPFFLLVIWPRSALHPCHLKICREPPHGIRLKWNIDTFNRKYKMTWIPFFSLSLLCPSFSFSLFYIPKLNNKINSIKSNVKLSSLNVKYQSNENSEEDLINFRQIVHVGHPRRYYKPLYL